MEKNEQLLLAAQKLREAFELLKDAPQYENSEDFESSTDAVLTFALELERGYHSIPTISNGL